MVLLGEKSDVLFYDVGNGERSDSCHTGVVAFATLFVAVNGAGATVQVLLYNLAAVWLQSGEAGKGVGGSPYRDDRSAHKRTEVHICRVHCEHNVEVGHQAQFLLEICFAHHRDNVLLRDTFTPFFFFRSASKQENFHVVVVGK